MNDKVRVVNLATFTRHFCMFETILDPFEPVKIHSSIAGLMQKNSKDFDQNKDHIRFSGVDAEDMVTMTNISSGENVKIIHIKFPRLLLNPGDNFIDLEVLNDCLNDPSNGQRLLSLNGQRDGVIFRDPRNS